MAAIESGRLCPAEGTHLSVLPYIRVQLLQPLFPLVELALPVKPKPRSICLWCRATLLEDPAFVAMKEAILDYAASAAVDLAP